MPNPNIVVLGTGMAGFGYRLHAEGIALALYDKNNYHGGRKAYKDVR